MIKGSEQCKILKDVWSFQASQVSVVKTVKTYSYHGGASMVMHGWSKLWTWLPVWVLNFGDLTSKYQFLAFCGKSSMEFAYTTALSIIE